MYRKIMIANRADCALRLIRGAHAVGAKAVLAVAASDKLPLVVREADEVVVTGDGRDAYLDASNLIAAARLKHCEALLPGWGFLSEDPQFAQQCRLAGIHFVGPTTSQLQLFNDKLETINTLCLMLNLSNVAIRCDAPNLADKLCDAKGSWALKRRTGGGGKGVWLCASASEALDKLRDLTKTSHCSEFYLEPRVTGRHIEFQIFGDGRGNARVLGIRDCSEQRRCQKLREFHVPFSSESWLCPFVRQLECAFAQLQFKSWGTLETLVESNGCIHLLEVNPRLQVEHGVTEMATGIDLVVAALRLEFGNTLDDALKTDAPIDSENVEVVEQRYYTDEPGFAILPVFEGYTWPRSPFDDDLNFRLETSYLPTNEVTGVFDGMVARIIRRNFKTLS